MRGQWLGRVQPICGARMYLFEDGREAEAQRQADYAAEQTEQIKTSATAP